MLTMGFLATLALVDYNSFALLSLRYRLHSFPNFDDLPLSNYRGLVLCYVDHGVLDNTCNSCQQIPDLQSLEYRLHSFNLSDGCCYGGLDSTRTCLRVSLQLLGFSPNRALPIGAVMRYCHSFKRFTFRAVIQRPCSPASGTLLRRRLRSHQSFPTRGLTTIT